MNPEARDFWERARKTLATASTILSVDPDSAASRAYYAGFYAVSAWFAREGKFFVKHAALESAVHLHLVRPGLWPKELGAVYNRLRELRNTGDYGRMTHVLIEDAKEAIAAADLIIQAVHLIAPADFPR